jgi:cytochrome c peroxidase
MMACGQGPKASAPYEQDSPDASPDSTRPPDIKTQLATLVLPKETTRRADPTNRYADDPRAAELGQKFFFDTRFSGPLLDSANDGTSGTLGARGQAGKIACASCHIPDGGAFVDVRSPREQLSLGSGWTHRKAPSLLDVAELPLLMWDGRRDSAFSQVFSPVESALEMNSSRVFVAQQIARLYRADYEAIFGPMPPVLDTLPALAATDAGCATMPEDPVHDQCPKTGADDDSVTRVLVNFGKAIQAFTRKLTCGRGRFDDWMDGDASALTSDEQAGALLFVGKGACSACHVGPYLTDRGFHNLGVPGELVPFTGVFTTDDPGAGVAAPKVLQDPLNSKGVFSDGYDGRLDGIPADPTSLTGSFHTPSLRCVGRRPSYMHNAEFRSLEDLVAFFSEGSPASGYVGTADNYPRNFTADEQKQLVAFLRALEGNGPDAALTKAPMLPP